VNIIKIEKKMHYENNEEMNNKTKQNLIFKIVFILVGCLIYVIVYPFACIFVSSTSLNVLTIIIYFLCYMSKFLFLVGMYYLENVFKIVLGCVYVYSTVFTIFWWIFYRIGYVDFLTSGIIIIASIIELIVIFIVLIIVGKSIYKTLSDNNKNDLEIN